MFSEISQNSQEKHLCQSLFERTLAQVFSCEFREISKNTFCCRTPRVYVFTTSMVSPSYGNGIWIHFEEQLQRFVCFSIFQWSSFYLSFSTSSRDVLHIFFRSSIHGWEELHLWLRKSISINSFQFPYKYSRTEGLSWSYDEVKEVSGNFSVPNTYTKSRIFTCKGFCQ